jgi:hypothetical protein
MFFALSGNRPVNRGQIGILHGEVAPGFHTMKMNSPLKNEEEI